MKAVKFVAGLAIFAVLLFVFLAKFSAVESRFECSGDISAEGVSHPTTIYMVLTEYRWWVGLWSDYDGNIWVELPDKTLHYYGNIEKILTNYHINDPISGRGTFSTLSKALDIKTPYGFFDGKCKNISTGDKE